MKVIISVKTEDQNSDEWKVNITEEQADDLVVEIDKLIRMLKIMR